MHWLFVLGISFDLAGAALVVWTISARSHAEDREEAIGVFGANLWVVLFHEPNRRMSARASSFSGSDFSFNLLRHSAGSTGPPRVWSPSPLSRRWLAARLLSPKLSLLVQFPLPYDGARAGGL
jgi:hypothetical protein